MALVALNWYSVLISPFADPPWPAGACPTVPSTIANRILLGGAISVFCLDADATSATITFSAGTAVGVMVIPQACMTIASTPTMDTTTLDDGSVWYSIRSAGAWIYYDTGNTAIKSLASPAALSTFLA